VHRDGHLIELKSRTAAKAPTIQEQMFFFTELKRVQETRGYRRGWTAHKFKERFGDWPPLDFQRLPSSVPTAATLRWVQSRNIAWAKAQQGAV
jgi:hypothetical protein